MNLEELPPDVLQRVISFVPFKQIVKTVNIVSKCFQSFASDDSLWSYLCRRDFNMATGWIMTPDNWPKEYMAMHKKQEELACHPMLRVDRSYRDDCEIDFEDQGYAIFENTATQLVEDLMAVQSIRPIAPLPLGDFTVGYYEIKMINGGTEQHIGMGVARHHYEKMMPGWGKGSVGYHADDGRLFLSLDYGREFTEVWRNGDICGCGVDFMRSNVFFTRNGVLLGTYPFPYVLQGLYPTVATKMKGEKVGFNTGNLPFAFDVLAYQDSMRNESPPLGPIIPYSKLVPLFEEGVTLLNDMYKDEDYDPLPDNINAAVSLYNSVIFVLENFPDDSKSLHNGMETLYAQYASDFGQNINHLELPQKRKILVKFQNRRKLEMLCEGLMMMDTPVVKRYGCLVHDYLSCMQVISDNYNNDHPLVNTMHRKLEQLGISLRTKDEDTGEERLIPQADLMVTLLGAVDSQLLKIRAQKRETIKQLPIHNFKYFYYNILTPEESQMLVTASKVPGELYKQEELFGCDNGAYKYITPAQHKQLLATSAILTSGVPNDDPSVLQTLLDWCLEFRYFMGDNIDVGELRTLVSETAPLMLNKCEVWEN